MLVTIELICSHLSGKKKVFRDGKQIFEVQKFGTSFQYPFQIGNHMLNIVQHGDIFELRIDNQSFSHLYHQDRTKRAFTYDGDQQPESEDRQEYKQADYRSNNAHSNNASDNNDFGYGGYKKGHQDVDANWYNQNKGNMNKNENNMWDDVRKAKNTSTSNYENSQKKPYDSFSPARKDETNGATSGGSFNFGSYDSNVLVKKAQYVNKQKETENNLLDLGSQTQQQNKLDDMLNFGKGQATQSNQGGFFDFDFNTSNQQQKNNDGGFYFDFKASNQEKSNQPKAFDFNSFSGGQQQKQTHQKPNPEKNLLDIIETQPQASLDDLLGGNNNNSLIHGQQNQNQQNAGFNFDEQKRIQDLMANGYSQNQKNIGGVSFQPNIQLNAGPNMNQQVPQNISFSGNFQINDKENQEKKLVNLENMMGGNQEQMKINSHQDPFAEAFNKNNTSQLTQNKNDAFGFVQQQLSGDNSVQNQTQKIEDTKTNMISDNVFSTNNQTQSQSQQQQQTSNNNDFNFGFQQNTNSTQNNDFNFF